MDEALFFNLEKAEVGCILGDHGGLAILAVSVSEQHMTNPVYIEAILILRGL